MAQKYKIETNSLVDSLWTKICAETRMIKNAIPKKRKRREREKSDTKDLDGNETT